MLRRLLLLTAVLLAATACDVRLDASPGNDETDRIARVVSDAISWPRPDSAMGYARAAASTTAAKDGRLTVIGVEELDAEGPDDALARLTYRIHLKGSTGGFFETDPVTACYVAEFDGYGVEGSPERVECPAGAKPVAIPTPAPVRAAEVPQRFDRVLRRVLSGMPAGPEATAVEAAVTSELRARGTTPFPRVTASVDGSDVGVAVSGDDDCLLGARVAGRVQVWVPPAVMLQPGELTCDAGTALAQQGQQAPH